MKILSNVFILLFFLNKALHPQDSTSYFKFVEIGDYSNYQGVIAPDSYDLTWLKGIKSQFTLEKKDIIASEETLLQAIKNATEGDSGLTNRAIQRYREFYRQYAGIIDENGKKKVFINMIRPGGITGLEDKNYWRKAFLLMTNWSDKYRVARAIDLEKKKIADDYGSIAIFICDCYYSKTAK
jgi:hypothetical protein